MAEMRNLEIDRLRAFAVLLTIYAHLDFLVLSNETWLQWTRQYINGGTGVVLFFVISGFVISKALAGALDGKERKSSVLTAFWIKRLTRITPLATLWVAIPLIFSWGFNQSGIFNRFEDNLWGAVAAGFNVFNIYSVLGFNKSIFGVYWSLSLEEQFYLLLPFFLLLVTGRWPRVAALVVVAACIPLIPWGIRSGFRFEGIVYGVLIYFLATRTHGWNVPRLVSGGLTVILLVSLATSPHWQGLHYEIVYQMPALISVVLVWLAVLNKGWILSLGQRADAVLDWIGTRSFGLYLIHIPAFQFAGELAFRLGQFESLPVRVVIATVFLVAVTEVCYRYVEVPIRAWGRERAKHVEWRRHKQAVQIEKALYAK